MCGNRSVQNRNAVGLLNITDIHGEPFYYVHYCLVAMCLFIAECFIQYQTVSVMLVCAVAEFLTEKIYAVNACPEVKVDYSVSVAVLAEDNAFFHNNTSFHRLAEEEPVAPLRAGSVPPVFLAGECRIIERWAYLWDFHMLFTLDTGILCLTAAISIASSSFLPESMSFMISIMI